jgi:[acyl-carrier-protein] S-malonyltransferase
MKKAYVFPGQGSQFVGMGLDLYQNHDQAKKRFELADSILGFEISKIMFEGTMEELTRTDVTQPAIFIHSVIAYEVSGMENPDMVAGHSLGEFSALVANGSLSFEEGLKLVSLRAREMQKACEINPSTMAAVLGLDNDTVDAVCASVEGAVVVPANYNCPGQLVISGSFEGIEVATEKLKEAGAKRVLPLKVGGAFHSPLMEPARIELQKAIEALTFNTPICPIYQNATAMPSAEPQTIKNNLITQLTAPVKWTQSVEHMSKDGATEFVEFGPGQVLTGLIKKIIPQE